MQSLQKMCPWSQHIGSLALETHSIQLPNFIWLSCPILCLTVPYCYNFCLSADVNTAVDVQFFECLDINYYQS